MAPWWNKSSRACPRPGGVSLRSRQRARGGGAPGVELLYRSLAFVLLLLRRAVKVRGFCLEAAEQDAGFVEGRWMDHTHVSLDCGGRRRRVEVQDRRSSGCDPGRWAIGDAFISSVWVSAYCDSSKPCRNMVPPDLVRKTANRRLPAVAGGSRFGKIGGVEGPRVFNVILWFVRGLSTKFLPSVSFLDVPVLVRIFVQFP